MYERMIVTDDGSELARSAIPRAAALAVAVGSEVLVLRVSHADGADPGELAADEWQAHVGGDAAALDRSEPHEAEPHLSEVVDALRAGGVARAGSLLIEGDPGDAIVAAAERLNAGLLVLSSHGLGGFKRAVLGSVATHVVRHVRGVPVLLCRPLPDGADGGIARILLTLDGSELSAAALPHAEQIARATGAELVLMRVTDSVAQFIAAATPISADVPAPSMSIDVAEAAAAEERAQARSELEALAVTLRAGGVTTVSIELAAGDAGQAIVGAAARLDADIVVMATHGRSGLGRAIFGSVADAVVRHIDDAAVLLVNPESAG